MDHYSLSEFISNSVSYVRTKLFYRQCRFIRFPLYMRGRKSMEGAVGLTLGRLCRFELDGDRETLRIGDNCEMGDMTHIVALNSVDIGDNVLIASKCFISDTSHGQYSSVAQDDPCVPPNVRKLVSTSVVIGSNVWIGENAVILPGAKIGDGCIVGANSIVNSAVPKNTMVVGVNRLVKTYNTKSCRWEKNG